MNAVKVLKKKLFLALSTFLSNIEFQAVARFLFNNEYYLKCLRSPERYFLEKNNNLSIKNKNTGMILNWKL